VLQFQNGQLASTVSCIIVSNFPPNSSCNPMHINIITQHHTISTVPRDKRLFINTHIQLLLVTKSTAYHIWCQDTSDPGYFGPKTFRHYQTGAEVNACKSLQYIASIATSLCVRLLHFVKLLVIFWMKASGNIFVL